ncbi:MAG: hypothetical protein COB36_11925 [Alphaproteobacteria bacterium]|nr:MAG: hypothetical protein COB36_11925 [Alphaproteobacteria bacterium]
MKVIPGEVYNHKGSGLPYEVILISNSKSNDEDKFPVTVVYHEFGGNRNIWSRPIVQFKERFELC